MVNSLSSHGRRHRSRRTFAVPVALFVLQLAACQPTYSGSGDKLGMLGDSITDQSRDELVAALSDTHAVSIAAYPGIRIDQMLQEAENYAASEPNQMVVFLGNNDIDDGFADVDEMLDTFADVPCVAWLTITTHTMRPVHDAMARALNARLFAEQATLSNFTVIDWNSYLFPHIGEWTYDLVHLTQMRL